jgi:hypothetical protein
MGAQSDIWMSVHTPVSDFFLIGRREENPRLALKLLVVAHEILEKSAGKHQVVYPFRGAGHYRVIDELRVVLALPATFTICLLVYRRGHGPDRYRSRPGWRGCSKRMRRIQGRAPRGLILREPILWAREAPDVVNHVISGIAGEERCKGIFGSAGCDLNSIGDDKGSHFLFERDNVIDRNAELTMRMSERGMTVRTWAVHAHW